jgi:hypothetical protein
VRYKVPLLYQTLKNSKRSYAKTSPCGSPLGDIASTVPKAEHNEISPLGFGLATKCPLNSFGPLRYLIYIIKRMLRLPAPSRLSSCCLHPHKWWGNGSGFRKAYLRCAFPQERARARVEFLRSMLINGGAGGPQGNL